MDKWNEKHEHQSKSAFGFRHCLDSLFFVIGSIVSLILSCYVQKVMKIS
jgi:hypothetical protein